MTSEPSSEQSNDSNVGLQYPVTVKEEPLPDDDDRIPAIYSETVVTKEELILEDDYLDNEEDMEVDCQPDSSDEGYRCNTCQETFRDQEMLSQHMLILCDKQYEHFIDVELLNREGLIKCTRCRKPFKEFTAARFHFENHTTLEKFRYECDVCYLGFGTKAIYTKHMATHKKNVELSLLKYQCHDCDEVYTDRATFKEHLKRHESLNAGKYKCEICSSFYTTRSDLKRHELSFHKQLSSIWRDTCEESPDVPLQSVKGEPDAVVFEPEASSMKGEFIIEEIPEEEEELVQPSTDGHLECPQCGRKFSKQYLLQNHIRDHRNLETERYKCDVCGKCFPKKFNLNLHKKIHKRGTRYECQTCHEKFTNHMGLMKHERVHVMDPKYVELLDNIPQDETGNWRCIMCEAKFPLRTAAYGHLRRHISRLEDTFLCKLCGLRCTKKSTFRAHMQTHESWNELANGEQPPDNAGESEGELPNPDVVCEKGEVPLHCKTCDKFFLTKRDLHVHVQKSEIRFLKLKLAAEKGIKVEGIEIEQDQ